MTSCNICVKRVLSHSYFLTCELCKCKVHLNCLSMIDKNDPLYVNRNQNSWICTVCSGNVFPFNNIYDNNEFLAVLSENWNESTQFSLSILQDKNKNFSPFELNENINSPLLMRIRMYNSTKISAIALLILVTTTLKTHLIEKFQNIEKISQVIVYQ